VKQYVRTSNEFHYYDGLMKYGCICFFMIYHLELVPADMNIANDMHLDNFILVIECTIAVLAMHELIDV